MKVEFQAAKARPWGATLSLGGDFPLVNKKSKKWWKRVRLGAQKLDFRLVWPYDVVYHSSIQYVP